MSPRTRAIRTLCLCDCKRTGGRKFSRLPSLQNLQHCLFLEELNWLSNLTAEQYHNNSEQSKPEHAFGRTVRNLGINPAPGFFTILFCLKKESFPEREHYIKSNVSGKPDNFKPILCRVICPSCKQALCAPYQKGHQYSVQNGLSAPLPSYSEQNPQKTLHQILLSLTMENTCLFQSSPNRYLRYLTQVLCSWRTISQF